MSKKLEWDKKTNGADSPAIDSFAADIKKAINLKIRIKAAKDELDGLEEQFKELSKDIIEPAFTVLNTKNAGIVGVGGISWRGGSSPAVVNGTGVIEFLVMNGIDPDLAKKAVDENTTPGKKYTYFQYYKA